GPSSASLPGQYEKDLFRFSKRGYQRPPQQAIVRQAVAFVAPNRVATSPWVLAAPEWQYYGAASLFGVLAPGAPGAGTNVVFKERNSHVQGFHHSARDAIPEGWEPGRESIPRSGRLADPGGYEGARACRHDRRIADAQPRGTCRRGEDVRGDRSRSRARHRRRRLQFNAGGDLSRAARAGSWR